VFCVSSLKNGLAVHHPAGLQGKKKCRKKESESVIHDVLLCFCNLPKNNTVNTTIMLLWKQYPFSKFSTYFTRDFVIRWKMIYFTWWWPLWSKHEENCKNRYVFIIQRLLYWLNYFYIYMQGSTLGIRENKVLRRIFGDEWDEIRGGWRSVHNEDMRLSW
jgi:hypothetical protein